MVQNSTERSRPLANWIEENICLPAGVTAEPGPIKLYPYQRSIAEAIADPRIERVSVLKSARIGYTALMTAALAHFIVREPGPILLLMPTEADCRGLMVDDIEPLFLDSPAIRDKLPMPRPGRSDRNTLLHRLFDGGSLKVVPGKAPRNLRRHNARVLMIDEVDAIEVSAEGDPVSLAEKRTLSFANRKIICGSTPLDEETSHIARLYSQSDQRVWEVPCPHCRAFNEIRWPAIEWPTERPELAAWRCPSCRAVVDEQHKPQMLTEGRWRALRPEVGSGHAGFKINALASLLPNASWGKLAAEYLRAKDDADTLKVFVNTVLGEPWREQADEVEEADLARRAEGFDIDHIPPEVLAVTVGGDCQDDRIELSLIGHARDGSAFVLSHSVVWGSPLDDDTWAEVDKLLRQRWQHPLGGTLKVDAAVIDAGDGGHYDAVMAFCNARMSRRILAGKGAGGFARPAIQVTRTKRGRLFIIGVDVLKTQIINRLSRGQTIRFSHTLDATYFEQLASERRVVRMTRGRPMARFERKPGMQAEALDCLTYALAAKAALSLNAAAFDQRQDALCAPTMPVRSDPRGGIPSTWMSR
jgi:phage terminase large subunit GpA-like protein